ncbi:MAG: hypothetical protein GY858_09470 [Candidatus Omnitrophica bacterium]|nr:hypothetical protein [Candidatus Omnitrophota bacterium]
MDKNSEKAERFRKLAEKRTNEVLKKLKILGNCSNRSVYEYSQSDIVKIFSAIDSKIREAKARFRFPKHKKFKL